MRVLHLLNHTRRLNGHVHAAVDLACAQSKLGHSIAVASGGGDFDELLARNSVEQMVVNHHRRSLELLKSVWALASLVRRWRPDVIHAHMVTSALLAWPVCRLSGVPLVTTVHNSFERSAVLMGVGSRVIAVSAAVAKAMQMRGIRAERLKVVLNGTIGSSRFDDKDRTPRHLTSPSIVFVGGQHPRKGLPDLFRAFAEVHDSNPSTRLYIVGDGPFLSDYRDLVKQMTCSDSVEFFGAQDNPFPFLYGADIFVLPSHADPAPLVISEAREAGCAVVATNVDGIPELLEQGQAGILVEPNNPRQLAAVLRDLVSNPDELQFWRSSSQKHIGRLSVSRVAREVLEVYGSIAS